MDKVENLCYGLDVSNNHDVGVVTFKFLDTDKSIHLSELELSILANYILDQYTTTDITSSLDVIKNIGNRLNVLESNLLEQIGVINNPIKVDIDKLLLELNSKVTKESRTNLSNVYPDAIRSVIDR